jgi:hypothetical protein
VSKTSEFGTILSCIEKHLQEVRENPPPEVAPSRSGEVWDLG